MTYTEFTAGDKEYKLRLNTQAIVLLEKKIGCNPLAIFGSDGQQMPTVTTLVAILAASLKQYNHGITDIEAYDIFDDYLKDGHTVSDFVYVVMDIYKCSGIIKDDKDEDSDEKNG